MLLMDKLSEPIRIVLILANWEKNQQISANENQVGVGCTLVPFLNFVDVH